MKLESLKNDKFTKFIGSELENAFKIVGGEPVATTIDGGTADCRDYETDDTGHTDGAGTPWDFMRKPCAPELVP